jgi:hypothetical protein
VARRRSGRSEAGGAAGPRSHPHVPPCRCRHLSQYRHRRRCRHYNYPARRLRRHCYRRRSIRRPPPSRAIHHRHGRRSCVQWPVPRMRRRPRCGRRWRAGEKAAMPRSRAAPRSGRGTHTGAEKVRPSGWQCDSACRAPLRLSDPNTL